MLPLGTACKAGASLFSHGPTRNETGTPPWCCPKRAEFWRLCCASWRAAYLEIGAAAGNRTRTCSVAGSHSAVKSQPRKVRGPGAFVLPAHAISTKNKHLLMVYSTPARGFTAALSVFRGTPPPKPLKCKIWFDSFDALFGDRWADPTRGQPRLSCARFSLASVDILKMSRCSRSRSVHLSLLMVQSCRENKTPRLRFGKRGVETRYVWFVYPLTSLPSRPTSGFRPIPAMDRPGLNTQPWLNRP